MHRQTFLVVQWLRLQTSNKEGIGSIPGCRTKIPHATCWPKNKNKKHTEHLLSATNMVQRVKNLPAMWEMQVQSLSWEDSLEKGVATHSSILAWRIPWTEKPGRLQSMGSHRVGHD